MITNVITNAITIGSGDSTPNVVLHFNLIVIMITYEVRMNDGDPMGSYNTIEEARERRSDINHRYISRWANIYQVCYSKVTGFYSSKKLC
jgi:hypothetical protein